MNPLAVAAGALALIIFIPLIGLLWVIFLKEIRGK